MNQNWLQHALRDTPFKLQRQAIALAGLGLFVAIIIGALYLAQSTSVATLGRQLEELIAKRDQLEQTNEQLRSEIAELRSVPRLIARAKDLGFVDSGQQNIEYLVVDGYNPHRVEATPPPESVKPDVPEYDESFVGWLQQQWDAFSEQLKSFSSGASGGDQ
jgi:cell division protein FtsB